MVSGIKANSYQLQIGRVPFGKLLQKLLALVDYFMKPLIES
jgi:hypothetical protein